MLFHRAIFQRLLFCELLNVSGRIGIPIHLAGTSLQLFSPTVSNFKILRFVFQEPLLEISNSQTSRFAIANFNVHRSTIQRSLSQISTSTVSTSTKPTTNSSDYFRACSLRCTARSTLAWQPGTTLKRSASSEKGKDDLLRGRVQIE